MTSDLVTFDPWPGIVAEARASVVDPEGARRQSTAHARALAAGAGLYRDQRERGSAADRASLLLAGVAAAEQILAAEQIASIDPAVVAELGDRSLDGLAALAQNSFGQVLVDALVTEGSVPAPEGASAGGLAVGEPGHDLLFPLDDGTTVAAGVVVGNSSEAIVAHFAAHPDVALVYASSDAVSSLPDGIAVVAADATTFQLDGPTVVDIGLDSAAFDDALAATVDGSFDLGGEVVDAVPVFALGLIAARATQRLLTTDHDASAVRDDALTATSDVFVNSGVGQLASIVTGAKFIAAPVTISTALTRTVARRTSRSVGSSTAAITRARHELARIAPWYRSA